MNPLSSQRTLPLQNAHISIKEGWGLCLEFNDMGLIYLDSALALILISVIISKYLLFQFDHP